MKTGFLLDDLRQVNPTWHTTAYLMYECNQRGHSVYFFESHDVFVRDNHVVARMLNISVEPNLSKEKYWDTLLQCLDRKEFIFETITALDALFLRKNKPINYEVMEFLGLVNDKVFILNSIRGQVKSGNKLYSLNFPEIIPETHVSRDPIRLKKVIDDFDEMWLSNRLEGVVDMGL